MNTRNHSVRDLLIPVVAMAFLGLGACASAPRSHTTVRETEHTYRGADEVCREKVTTEQKRDRDNDRTRVATTETVCRDR